MRGLTKKRIVDKNGKVTSVWVRTSHKAKVETAKTKAFKKWFGKSKVVDKNGKPLKVYHGTMAYEYVPMGGRADAFAEVFNQALAHLGKPQTYKPAMSTVLNFGKPDKTIDQGDLKAIYQFAAKHPNVLDMKKLKYADTSYVPFKEFKIDQLRSNTGARDADLGFFFTPDRDFAQRFTYQIETPMLMGRRIGEDKITHSQSPHIYEVYLKMENPINLVNPTDKDVQKYIDDGLFLNQTVSDVKKDIRNMVGSKELQKELSWVGREKLMGMGYDGVMNKVKYKKKRVEYTVFSPEQIKIEQ